MADRSERMLADCLAAQRARVGRAEALHAAAIVGAKTAGEAAHAAADALVAAEADWQRQMAEGFDPVLGSMLADQVRGRAATVERTAASRSEADAARERSAAGWRHEDARRGAIEEQAAAALRAMRRAADERLLATLADRETFRRSGR